MKDTLITGVLLAMPAAVLLASAALALLVNKLRLGLRRAGNRFHRPDMTPAGVRRRVAARHDQEGQSGHATSFSSASAARLHVVAVTTGWGRPAGMLAAWAGGG
jgi:hypothetical protein